MKRVLAIIIPAAVGLVLASLAALAAEASGAGGVTGPAFYVDGALYRTVGTPTDFSNTGAPASTFNAIYDFGGAQPNVADAAPGDRIYRGGRWQVHALAFKTSYAATAAAHDANASGDLDSVAEVMTALADGGPGGAADLGIVKSFECPVIKLPPTR